MTGRRAPRSWVGYALLALVLYGVSILASEATLRDAVPVVIYAIAALGLNILVGTAGVISLGAPAFFGIGAFSVAYLTGDRGWPFLAAVVAGTVMSAIVSLPFAPIAGRLKGVYLAIATAGIVFLGLHVFRTAEGYTGGVNGTTVPTPAIGNLELDSVVGFYRFASIVLVAVTVVTMNLLRSKTGRALRMLETSPVAARSLGISPLRYRTIAFIFSSVLAAISGALLAGWQEYVSWDQFQFAILGWLIAIIVIGGRNSVYGTIVAALIVMGLPDLIEKVTDFLPFIAESTSSPGITARSFANLVSGTLIVAVIVLEPGGLAKLGARVAGFASARLSRSGRRRA